MILPRLVKSWLCGILAMAMSGGLARGDDTPLAPNHTIGLGAKLMHPVISPRGDYLYWLNQTQGKLQRASLADHRLDERAALVAPGARSFCLSPDGATAYVAATIHDYSPQRTRAEQLGTVQAISLADLSVTASFDVKVDLMDLVADDHGFLYATSGSGQWEKIHKIDPREKKVLFGFGEVYSRSNLRITPDQQRLYLATNGVSPGNMSTTRVPTDLTSARSPVESRYHGEHPLGGAFDLTPDGKYAVNRDGTVLQLNPAKEADLLFVTTVPANLGIACDPAGGKMWVLQADGFLHTYTYPAFTREKSERLPSPGAALAYDAMRKTLWVVWADGTGAIGGLDAYNLASPATYPNAITKARATTLATATAANAAAIQRDREASRPTSPGDLVVFGLFALCSLFFIASVFFSGRAWLVPGGIKFIGWLTWLQVILVMSAVMVFGLSANTKASVLFARVTCGYAVLLGALAWGILRGNKICFVANGVLQIGIVVLSLCTGARPGLFAIVVVGGILHFGRKEWDSLT